MRGRWAAKNNPRDYGVARSFGAGLRDWRTLLGTLLLIRWIAIYPVDSVIQLLNYWGLEQVVQKVDNVACSAGVFWVGVFYDVAAIFDFMTEEDWGESSLWEFQHGAFASKDIRGPDENAFTAGYG